MVAVQEDNTLYKIALTCGLVYLLKTQAYWDIIPSFLYSSFLYIALLLAIGAAVTKISNLNPLEGAFLGVYFVVSIIVWQNTRMMGRLLLTIFLIIGAKGVPYKDIFKIYFLLGSSFLLATILAFSVGLIEQITMDSSIDREMMYGDAGIRYSLGYASPTDLANHFLYIQIAFWLYRKGRLNMAELLVLFFSALFIFKVSGSRLSFVCSLLLVVFVLFYKVKEKIVLKSLNWVFLAVVLVLSFLFIPLSVYFTSQYTEGDITWMAIDIVFSGRLRLGNQAINDFGYSMWGQFVEMVGCAADSEGIEETNYIDNSYIQLFVIYGFVYASFIIGTMLFLSYKVLKFRLDYVAVAIFMVSVEGVVAQHYMLIEFNPLLLACTALIEPPNVQGVEDKLHKIKRALLILKLKKMVQQNSLNVINQN